MIWEIVVWLIFFNFFMGAVITVHYWYDLLRTRDSYRREELIDLTRIIQDRFFDLMGRGDTLMNYAGLLIGVGIAILLTMLGGLFSPGSATAADHATNQIPNYFFQSALFPAILHITWPSLRDTLQGQADPVGRILDAEHLLFIGLAVGLAAVHVATWGVYHEMNFLWNLGNMCACLAYAGYRVDLALGQEYDIDEGYGEDDYGQTEYGRGGDFAEPVDADDSDNVAPVDLEGAEYPADIPEYPDFPEDK